MSYIYIYIYDDIGKRDILYTYMVYTYTYIYTIYAYKLEEAI